MRLAFLAGLAAVGKILTIDNFGSGMSLWLVGVVCVKGIRSLWIILFFIVRLLLQC
jgi:hypothetical protein